MRERETYSAATGVYLLLAMLVAGCASNGPGPVMTRADLETACDAYKIEFEPGIVKPKWIEGGSPQSPRNMAGFGVACAQVTVTVDGQVVDPEIVFATSEEFGSNVLRALTDWRYEPATRDGEPVEVRMMIRSNFTRTVTRAC